MDVTFTFYFPHLDQDRQIKVVESWGGHLGTALSRAWKEIKADRMYKGIKNLRPVNIAVEPAKKGK